MLLLLGVLLLLLHVEGVHLPLATAAGAHVSCSSRGRRAEHTLPQPCTYLHRLGVRRAVL
jgi:hypothetical protein